MLVRGPLVPSVLSRPPLMRLCPSRVLVASSFSSRTSVQFERPSSRQRSPSTATSSSHASGASSKAPPPRLLVQPLTPFVDERYPGPEPRVSAFLIGTAVDLRQLRRRLAEMGCPMVMWQGEVLLCGSSAEVGQQQCNAVFLPDGCAVCWNMSRETERKMLRIAADCPAKRRGPPHTPASASSWSSSSPCQPVASEHLEITDSSDGVTTSLDVQEGTLSLTSDTRLRTSHQLGLSLGLAVAVRLDNLERRIEAKLDAERLDLYAQVRSLNLSTVSHRIFEAETGLHELRYGLNSEAGVLDAPDLLWEHALAERLYDQVVAHFDVRRRTALLNDRLSYSLDYLHTLGEHVRHQYSVRLERAIVVIIFLELCLGVMSYSHEHPELGVDMLCRGGDGGGDVGGGHSQCGDGVRVGGGVAAAGVDEGIDVCKDGRLPLQVREGER
eukprot:TRINITY_DN42771_c0_g1_i1.p1 TRINITY_DN42771_c0_g1~~TRINITY_DN42771_c0_g1_i1.p1  ORF type:complete len:441 (+),score=57.72 TRINITY_DN42771_c0_g1_i1:83-1405(+)